ncbi:MAG: bifunctional UDP-N-acetylmuramoyl-tripeptide:D-alanyl-D-alanine ligase/alanine racemase [Cyclobacteriaceae bacterium]
MRISDIAKVIGAEYTGAEEDISILSIDSRKVIGVDHELFFALSGPNRDGHQFIEEAFEKGVRHFVVSDKPTNFSANFLVVKNVLYALQKLSAAHRHTFDYPVIGITGSNGKTIIKEWLSTMLSVKFNLVKSPKSYNSQVGVPLSVWAMNEHHELAIFEAGISEMGEMEKLEKIIKPTIGIFTNIGSAHDDGFKNQQAKIQEKLSLFSGAKKIIYCLDHEILHHEIAHQYKNDTVSWSLNNPEANYYFYQKGDELSFSQGEKTLIFRIKPYSGFYLENLIHVIVAANELGLSSKDIQSGIDHLKPVAMRLELKRGKNNVYLLDDTYNNDISGLKIALEYLEQQRQKSRTTIILSDFLQSGDDHEQVYQKVKSTIQNGQVNRIIVIGKEISRYLNLEKVEVLKFESTEHFLREKPYFGDEMVLVKGARVFHFERIVSVLEEKSHGTILEVNFESLIHNLNIYKTKLNPKTKLMVMVKAMAYGGGLNEIGKLLEYQKVDYLGVAYIDEALELRSNGIKTPIMVLNPDWSQLSLIQDFNIEPEVYNWKLLHALNELDNPPKFHLKIETGMNRLGFRMEELPKILDYIVNRSKLIVSGVFTHLSSSDDPKEDEFSQNQLNVFNLAYEQAVQKLGYAPMKHCLNSAGILRWPASQFDMVRLGIGLYGFDASSTLQGLRPISELKTFVSQVREVQAGESIGYGRNGRMEKDGVIATVSIGYADGYSRAFGNGRAFMTIGGQEARTIGNVCMDMTILDVTDLPVREGDEVVVFGKNPTIQDLATWAATIPYEILTNVNQRVKRVYISE